MPMTRREMLLRGSAVLAAAIVCFSVISLMRGNDRPPITIVDASGERRVGVQVQGAVATPGFYWLEGDARMQSALDAAGGPLGNADLSGVNLARRVQDEEQIQIPLVSSAAEAPASHAAASSPMTSGGKININTASASELDALPGIGPALAGKIVAFREAHGPFASVEELSLVAGISVRMVDDMRDLITLGA